MLKLISKFAKLFKVRRRPLVSGLIFSFAVIAGIAYFIANKQILSMFASTDYGNSRPDWCKYGYTDDQINGTGGWWQGVKDYFSYTPPETHDYSFNLKPVQEFAGLIEGRSNVSGRLVNIGTSFKAYGSGSYQTVWLYSFSGENVQMKIHEINFKPGNWLLGPVYSYKVYDQTGNQICNGEVGTCNARVVYYNKEKNTEADPYYPKTAIIIDEPVPSSGSYRLEINSNFIDGQTVKALPGYPISFGYKPNQNFPLGSTDQGFYFYVPNNINTLYAALRTFDTGTTQTEWIDPSGVRSPVSTDSKENRSDDWSVTGGALVTKTVIPGFWKLDVSVANSSIEQLYLYNVPNLLSQDRQYLMLPEEILADNGLTARSCPYQVDKVTIAGSSAIFDGTYSEVLEGPDLPTDLMPVNDPNWDPKWNGKKSENVIYRNDNHPDIYLVRSLGPQGFTRLGKGYYIIFDSAATNPNSEWYAYPAQSDATKFFYAGRDTPMPPKINTYNLYWLKGAGTWGEMDAGINGGWQTITTMKATDTTAPGVTTCP